MIHAMIDRGPDAERKWNQRSSEADAGHDETFRDFFARSPDAIWLFDPEAGVFVDCNEAAVALMRCKDRNELLQSTPADLSPPFQPDGKSSQNAALEISELVRQRGSLRFEWTARRRDGEEVPLEVLSTNLTVAGRPLQVVVSRDISERKRAEAQVTKFQNTLEKLIAERTSELRATEERFRSLVEHAPEAIVVFNVEARKFILCNENATKLFGRTREELALLSPEDVSPPVQPNGKLSSDAARDYISAAVRGEAPVFEWVHRHSSGRLIPCEIRLLRLPGPGLPLVRGSIIDTTDRKRREKFQRATYEISAAVLSAEDLNALYHRIHEIIARLMPAHNFYIALLEEGSGMVTFPYFVDLLATSPPEPRRVTTGLTGYVLRTGRTLLIDRSQTERKRQVDEGVLVEGMELPYVESGRPAAIWLGAPLTIRGRTFGAMAVQDYEDNKAYGEDEKQVLTFVAAQTALAIDRKRSERALRDSEEKFRALFEASSQGVMLHDEKQILEVNRATARILGYRGPEDFLGRHPIDASAPIQPNGEPAEILARKYIDECMTQGSARFDWQARTPEGKEIPIEVILTRIPMGGRQIIQAVINDISERKRAEEELLRSLAREKELGQLKSNFVSMVSHEFRTPLGIIMSSADILQDYYEQLDLEERARHLQSIHKNTRRMADLMEEVLLLGRLDAGRMQFDPAPADLRLILARITDEISAATERRCPIQFECRVTSGQARIDERLLSHIFTNLLSNAVKYSEPGATVIFSVEKQGSDVVCLVKDRGIGIPEADQQWLFHAFHRGGNVEQRPGSGLGLVIVKRCVELHQGTIWIDSETGVGTTVSVRLPVFTSRATTL